MTIENMAKTEHENRIQNLFKKCDNSQFGDVRTYYIRELIKELRDFKKTYGECYHLRYKPEILKKRP